MPTLLLRGVLETTEFAGTPLRAFGEFDFGIIYPPGSVPPDPAVREALGLARAAEHDGITVFGDAKSWRKLGRLDNGDKRAAVAIQVALYTVAATTTWPTAQAATVQPVGLIANPPSTGGLATVKLTRVDLSDPLRTLYASADRGQQVVAAAIPQIAAAVATWRSARPHRPGCDHRRDRHPTRLQRVEPRLPQQVPARPDLPARRRRPRQHRPARPARHSGRARRRDEPTARSARRCVAGAVGGGSRGVAG